jgi:hypothetical protein
MAVVSILLYRKEIEVRNIAAFVKFLVLLNLK